MVPPRCRRHTIRNMSGVYRRRSALLRFQLAIAAIERQENLFEAWLVADEVDHVAIAQRLHERFEAATDDAVEPAVLDFDAIDAGRPLDGLDGHGPGKLDLDLVETDLV